MRYTVLLLWILILAACAPPPPVTPVATGGSKADGTVEMSYLTRAGPQPEVNWTSADAEATARCAAWGFAKAERFGGGSLACHQYGTGILAGSCMQGQITVVYQCLDA